MQITEEIAFIFASEPLWELSPTRNPCKYTFLETCFMKYLDIQSESTHTHTAHKQSQVLIDGRLVHGGLRPAAFDF